MKKIFFAITLLTLSLAAQSIRFKGIVLDSADNSPLISASIRLQNVRSGSSPQHEITDTAGRFVFHNLSSGRYALEISFIGYKDYRDTIRIFRNNDEDYTIRLIKSFVQTEQIEVTGQAILTQQKEDTLQFNAKSIKVNTDANAEDLVTKIPGVQNDNGVIKAHGEEVKQVLVDGRPFFGDDPTIALKNLPSEVIDKVQIYDRMSDQSSFTGFDDGNSQKTINIITRQGMNDGRFGKLYGGYGTDERFLSGATVNYFKPDQRISLIGLGNNINRQNFSMQDLLGVTGQNNRNPAQNMMRGPGGPGGQGRGGPGGPGGGNIGNFLVGNQDGNTNTYSIGTNYMQVWEKTLQLSGSYFFNYAQNSTDQSLNREYYSLTNQARLYDESSLSNSKNLNHRINLRAEYTIDTMNSLIFSPRFSVQNNNSNSDVEGVNHYTDNTLISKTDYQNNNHSVGFNYNSDLLLRHKFDTPGRTISLNLSTGFSGKDYDAGKYALNGYYTTGKPTADTTDQRTDQTVRGSSLGSELNVTEASGENGLWQFSFNAGYDVNKSDKNTNALDKLTGLYDDFVTSLSNDYRNSHLTLRGGVSYRYRTDALNLSAGLSYQQSTLKGEQIFPYAYTVDKRFGKPLPSMRLMYRIDKSDFIRINYFTGLNAPSISQLQNTTDNSNPLYLKGGNPDLEAEYNHRIMAQYMTTNAASGANLFAMAFFGLTDNSIGNITRTLTNDTVLSSGYSAKKGAQITSPYNFDRSINVRSFVNYGFPITPILCNLNFNAGFNYGLTPGMIDNVINKSRSYSTSAGIALVSNISEDIDFRISYTPNYYLTRNDQEKSLDKNYWIHNAMAAVNWIFWGPVFIRGDYSYYHNTGLGEGIKDEYSLVNLGIGSKLFENNKGEIRLEVFDVLDQNTSLNRTVNETYIENKSTRVLQRFYLLTFTYNLSLFGQ